MEVGYHIIQILGSLALFIYGMKVMSDGIQRAAGNQLRATFRNVTKNRYLGFLTGFLSTAVMQSSSATTVMTVSFVNAGLMTLKESVGIMMGANVGTTITAWVVAVFGFKFPIINSVILPFIAIGVIMIFSNNNKFKYWGEFLIGFGILFLGLDYLKESFPEFNGDSPLYQWISSFASSGFLSSLFFIFLGAVLTLLFQSSSAAMILTITMCAKGWISFDHGAAMVLGENIGTTITAELAALVGNIHARRSARIHTLFNTIGLAWMILLLPYFVKFIAWVNTSFFHFGDPFNNPEAAGLGIAAFHTAFNLTTAILLIGFVPWLISLSKLSVKGKEQKDKGKITPISSNIYSAELGIIELKKQALNFGDIVSRSNTTSFKLFNSLKKSEQEELTKKIKKYQKIASNISGEISAFVQSMSKEEVTERTNVRLLSILNISNNLQQIANEYTEAAYVVRRKSAEKIWLTPDQRNNLNELFEKIAIAFKVMLYNLSYDSYSEVSKSEAKQIRKEISSIIDKLKKKQSAKVDEDEIHVKSVLIINDMLVHLENINQYIQNVTNLIRGKI